MAKESPKIGIVGTGYVGLVSGACFADLGYEVRCLDVVEEKVEAINSGIPPIFENGLEDLLQKVVLEQKLLKATLDREEMFNFADLIFICLPTPSAEDGSIELSYITKEMEALGKLLKSASEYKTFVVKSTVVPGTTSGIIQHLLESNSDKTAGDDFGIAMNPEFLMEGLAINNFTNPDRIVIGAINERSYNAVLDIYASFDCPIVKTSTSGAEMIKYAANSFLATKISFINEIANMCEVLGIDVSEVANGIGLDERIGSKFLRAGVGFGGSCFPKDTKALIALSKQIDRESNLLQATLKTNQTQPLRAVELLTDEIDVSGKMIAILGLAFKPETDDMREAPSILICNELRKLGAKVRGYDPIAKETAQKALPEIDHIDTISELLEGADAAILVTEWNEFKDLEPKDFAVMNGNLIVDGRRIFDERQFEDAGFRIKILGQ